MFWFKFVVNLYVLVGHYWSQNVSELQYTVKFDSPHTDDLFGFAIATKQGQLVIGDPWDNGEKGAVHLGHGVKIEAPHAGDKAKWFGLNMDMNDDFLVVSRWTYPSIYIYGANRPYELKASIPVEGDLIIDVVIGDSNTIVALRSTREIGCYVNIYEFDGAATWSLDKIFSVGSCRTTPEDDGALLNVLAISGNKLAVGFPYNDEDEYVDLYHNLGGSWSKTQTIVSPVKTTIFGSSITMDGDQLAVSGREMEQAVIFTYNFDQTTRKWLNTGCLHPPGDTTFVALKGDLLVGTVNQLLKSGRNREVAGVVYRLSAQNRHLWEKVGILKTNGVPTRESSLNTGVSIMKYNNGLVFIGRVNDPQLPDHVRSTVFVYSIAKLTSE